MAKNVGTVNFFANGALIESVKGAELKLGGLSATAEPTDQQLVHYSEEFKPAEVKIPAPVNNNLDIEALRALRDADGTFECDNGIVYTLTGLGAQNAAEWTLKSAPMDLMFFGNAAKPG